MTDFPVDWHSVGMALRNRDCYRCGEPIPGTPVTDPDDPLHRLFCREECLDAAAEAAGGAFRGPEYSTEENRP